MLSFITKFGYSVVLIEFQLLSTGNACTFAAACITTENNRAIHEKARKVIDKHSRYLKIYCLTLLIYICIYTHTHIYIYIHTYISGSGHFSIAEAQSVKVNYFKINWLEISNFLTEDGTAYYFFP
jgi:hypothetical protein